jgi:altronate dehydratase small subunit
VAPQVECFRVHPDDNVATALTDILPGTLSVGGGVETLRVLEPISTGHKIAIREIAVGTPIIKFGVPIGTATRAIEVGQWVHLHNCQSGFDERSGTLDLNSGLATDTRYE